MTKGLVVLFLALPLFCSGLLAGLVLWNLRTPTQEGFSSPVSPPILSPTSLPVPLSSAPKPAESGQAPAPIPSPAKNVSGAHCIAEILGKDASGRDTGLLPGHPPIRVRGPAVISVWLPEQPGTEYVSFLHPGEEITLTLPGQGWAYPSHCAELAERDAGLHAQRLAKVYPHVQVVLARPPRW